MQGTDAALSALLRRDRVVVGAALAVLTVLAWGYVLWLAAHMAMPMTPPAVVATPAAPAPSGGMAGMDMGSGASSNGGMAGMDMKPTPPSGGMAGMDMSGIDNAAAPAFRTWAPADFAFMFAMWSVMMVGMMTPSVAPMVLLYAGVGRKAAESGTPIASAGWFFAGYIVLWLAFSALATLAQWGLTQVALLTPMMAVTSTVLGGLVLLAAGLYQWTPIKDTCLSACQTPLGFLVSHGGFRRDALGAARLGARHGLYCLGCCFALMALLFVGGIMNLLWIAGLTILILLEKVVPAGRLIPRVSGAFLAAAGIWLVVRAL